MDVKDAKGKKIELPDVGRIVAAMQQRGMFMGIKRFRYDFTPEHGLACIEAVGKARNPEFTIDDENRFAYLNFIKWVHGDPTMQAISPTTGQVIPGRLNRGIYIGGNTGTGKSWCLDIVRAYAQARQVCIQLPDEESPSPLWWKTLRADEICETYAEKGTIHGFKRMPIVGVQDFGAEPSETLYMGNRIDVMRQFIEYRGDKSAEMTLITSNLKLGGDAMVARYGDRVTSRLCEMCNFLVIKGKDRRKN